MIPADRNGKPFASSVRGLQVLGLKQGLDPVEAMATAWGLV